MSLARRNLLAVAAGLLLCHPAFSADDEANRGVLILGPEAPAVPQPPPPPIERPDQRVLAAENAAGLSLDILPDTELAIGSKISFRVTAKRPGYLILVDVDASGKLTQIFPNSAALLTPEGLREAYNRVQPGKAVTIPDAGRAFGGFEFVISEPRGVAMAVAILSSEPVQLMDLPDVPTPLMGRADALKYLTDIARTLRIVRANATGRFAEPRLAFDAKFYVVK